MLSRRTTWILRASCVLGVTAAARVTLAAEDPPPAPPTTPAASTSASPPAKSEPTAVIAGVPIRFTGTLHAMVELTQGVQSFDAATAVAPTSALHPAVVSEPDRANLSFQVQQTRLGVHLGEGSPFHGVVEIDFVHFDQSSPTVQAFPRLRQALIEWAPAPEHKLFLGQTWDLFGNTSSPLLAHSFNLVGTMFRAGNVGFMRHQLGYSGRFGDLEIAAAAGLPGANAGPSFGNLEEALVPTGSLRVMAHLGEHGVVGASGIATGLRFTAPAEEAQYRVAFGGEVFADVSTGPLSLHAEVYGAQNLANTGALDLALGRFDTDVRDVGGYVSAKLQLGDHALTAMVGGAIVTNPDDVAVGYTPANPTGTPPTLVGTLAAGSGIVRNASAHVGYWYSPLKGLSIVAEPYVYATRFELTPEDDARLASNRLAVGAMLGSMFQF